MALAASAGGGCNQNGRVADHAIDPIFLRRWSPRAFSSEEISDFELMSMFEAARWAPSSYNSQPWRFVYARRGSAHWPRFLAPLSEVNQSWAKAAAALVTIVSKTTALRPGASEETLAYNHAFDTGAAWSCFALQAAMNSWATHCMAVLDRERAATDLQIPEGYRVEATVAIGKVGEKSNLPPALQEREFPSLRRPIRTFVSEGIFASQS